MSSDRVSLVDIHCDVKLSSLEQRRCIQLLSLLFLHGQSYGIYKKKVFVSFTQIHVLPAVYIKEKKENIIVQTLGNIIDRFI